jgi:HlyD family secretion protein
LPGYKRILPSALLILAAAGIFWYATRPEPVAVKLTTVERGRVEETVANTRAGAVRACRRALLSPASGGQIAQLNVREGDRVAEGQLLLELWNDDLKAEGRVQQAQYDVALANARAACLQAEVARREARRLRSLGKSGAVSEEALDKAQTQADSALAECESKNAGIAVAEAHLRASEANLTRSRLTAPFAGVVAEVNGELYEYVTPSPPGIPTPPVVDLIDDGCFYVSAPIDEVDAARVRVGQTAKVTLDAFRDRVFPGRVQRIAPYVLDREKQSRTLEVEVAFADPAVRDELLAGYSADVEVIIEQREDTLRLPSEAVLEGRRVFRFDSASGRIARQEIRSGLANWNHTEVLEGLREGDLVVTSVDREGVADGALARREEAAEAAQP